jgi:hypothetical protein
MKKFLSLCLVFVLMAAGPVWARHKKTGSSASATPGPTHSKHTKKSKKKGKSKKGSKSGGKSNVKMETEIDKKAVTIDMSDK